MAKRDSRKEAQIRANQQEAKTLLKSLASKSAQRSKLTDEIREVDARLKDLKKVNAKLGGYSATEGMRPKKVTWMDALKKVMRPGKKMSIEEIELKLPQVGRDLSNAHYPRESIGAHLKRMKGVHRVGASGSGTYVFTPPKKHPVTTNTTVAA